MFTLKDIADKLNLIFHIGDNEALKNMLFINNNELYGFRGKRKGTPQYLSQVQNLYLSVNENKLSEDYIINIRLIRSNYNMVRNYNRYCDSTHLYPNLEFHYERCHESKMIQYSKQFEVLDNIVLPIESPFWNIYLPPNHIEDNCYIYLTDKETTSIPNNLPIVDKRFIVDRHKKFFKQEPFYTKESMLKMNTKPVCTDAIEILSSMNINIVELVLDAFYQCKENEGIALTNEQKEYYRKELTASFDKNRQKEQ